MLQQLHIRNFVLVEHLNLDFHAGLTSITGETGAGKSVLMNALGLLLGDRADSGLIREGCEQTDISGVFEPNAAARAWLEAQSLDSNECIIRRVLNQTGRGRCYINGTPATVQNLSTLGEYLVDIHGQHAHQSLLKAETQRDLLDATLAKPAHLQAVREAHSAWQQTQKKLQALGGDQAERLARLDLLRYQVNELEQLELTGEGLAELEAEHQRLAHAGNLQEQVQQAYSCLDEPSTAISYLNQASRALQTVQQHDAKRLEPLVELLESAVIQAQEASDELQHYLGSLEIDPARLDWLESHLSTLQDLARKHQIEVEALPEKLEQLRQQLDDVEHYEERAAALEAECAQALSQYRKAAKTLSKSRQTAAEALSAQITQTMQPLGLEKARLRIAVESKEAAKPSVHGDDQIRFLVSTNPGQRFGPLHKVASGGELSRISLAIQVITAQSGTVSTLVFDEVDVGVGGAVAEIIGQQLAQLGRAQQVLCITHQPQVAAYGQQHLHVRKHNDNDLTHTDIVPLDEKTRVEELARMLGGLEITPQTQAHAQEMLQKSAQQVPVQ